MRKFTPLIALGLFAASFTAAPTVAASASAPPAASTHHCATHGDYRKVDDGMGLAHVAKIMGHYGRRGASSHYHGKKAQYRWYPPCAARTTIEIVFYKHTPGKWYVRAGRYHTTPPPPKPHCATHAEFNRVSHGMTIPQVRRILGHNGTVTDQSNVDGYGDQDRSYEACGDFSEVVVGFSKSPGTDWTETAKSGFFE